MFDGGRCAGMQVLAAEQQELGWGILWCMRKLEVAQGMDSVKETQS